MKNFIEKVEDKGAYIALMEDWIGEIDPTKPVGESDRALKTICKELDKVLDPNSDDQYIKLMEVLSKTFKTKAPFEKTIKDLGSICEKFEKELKYLIDKNKYELHVGSEKNGCFLEPCPIMHTLGEDLEGKSKVFDLIWIGLNPHYELAYLPNDWKWEEFSDFQMPKLKEGVPISDNLNILKNGKNIYHRVTGELQGSQNQDGWSPYYQWLFRFWYALCYERYFKNWEEFKADIKKQKKTEGKENYSMQDAFFEEFFVNHRMANLELIPFKSKEVLVVSPSCENEELRKKYDSYQKHLIKFITQYAKEDAWIIFYGKTDVVKKELKKNDIFPSATLAAFDKDYKLKLNGNNIYSFLWENRKVLLFPMIHGRPQQHRDSFALKNDLIGKIKTNLKK